jgi:hypothetical protein
MDASLRLSTVLRRTFGIYAEHAPVLLTAAIMVDVVALDRVQFRISPALANRCIARQPRRDRAVRVRGRAAGRQRMGTAGPAAAPVSCCGAPGRRSARFCWSGLSRAPRSPSWLHRVDHLLRHHRQRRVERWRQRIGSDPRPLVPVLLLVPEPFLLTVWSVLAAVAVLERPGGLRALGRSRELVRGNGWRVLALILMLAFPLALATSEIEGATRTVGSGPATAVRLLIATLIAPIPVLAATVRYFELRRAEPTPAPADPIPPIALPASTSLP